MNYSISKFMTYKIVHQMESKGLSVRKIADHLGMNWRTAKKLLDTDKQQFLGLLENSQKWKRTLDSYASFVKERLIKHPDTPAAQMHDWLKEGYADFPIVTPKT